MPEETAKKSFLDFGVLDETTGQRESRDLIIGQRAYDFYMVARYMNDLLAYRKLIELCTEADEDELEKIYVSEIHHASDASANLNKLCALMVMEKTAADKDRALRFFEFGSTLFGCIEGIEYCQGVLERCGNPVGSLSTSEIEWFGVDICEMFNRVANALHPLHLIQAFTRPSDVTQDCDVFFAKGVSLLYAVRSVSQFLALVKTAPLSVFDYSFSTSEAQEFTISTGKPIMYLGIREFLDALAKTEKKFLFRKRNTQIDKDRNRLFLDGIFGDPRYVDDFVNLDTRIRNAIMDGCSKNTYATGLLAGEIGGSESWILIEEFCRSNGLS